MSLGIVAEALLHQVLWSSLDVGVVCWHVVLAACKLNAWHPLEANQDLTGWVSALVNDVVPVVGGSLADNFVQ